MKAEGECPNCGSSLGVKIADGIASMFGSSIERLMDKDGNEMRCTNCGEYVSPEDVEVKE